VSIIIIGFYHNTGYGNAEEQPERSCGFYTETGDFLIARFARFRENQCVKLRGSGQSPVYAVLSLCMISN